MWNEFKARLKYNMLVLFAIDGSWDMGYIYGGNSPEGVFRQWD